MKSLAFFVTALIILAGTSSASDDLGLLTSSSPTSKVVIPRSKQPDFRAYHLVSRENRAQWRTTRNLGAVTAEISAEEDALKKSDTATNPVGASAQKSATDTSESRPMTSTQIAEMKAQILMARKDYANAAVAYQRLLEQDPHNARMLNQVGIAYQQLGQPALAERFYKRAFSADKTGSQALNNIGTIEYGRARYGKAIKDYKKAISIGGDLAPVYSNLAYAYCAIKAYQKAMDAFNSALAIDPNIFDSRGNTGSVMQQRTAVDQGELYFLLAKSYAKRGDAEHAAKYLKLARDDGYRNFRSAEKDPAFAKVLKDQRVQDVLRVQPAYAESTPKSTSN